MLLPYSTDAPIYHWPVVTVGLIAANVAAFIATLALLADPKNEALFMAYVLQYGQGLHPLQWLTANFLHADLFHLLGNMLGLWTFGLIVEGKIGWWRFLTVYLGLGAATMLVAQLLAQAELEGFCIGASGAIYGLLGMALVWAPANEISCFVYVWFRPITFEMSVRIMAVVYILMQMAILGFTGLAVTGELVHLIGAAFGIAVAVVMLRLDWVDCENWDFFSVWSGRNEMSAEELEDLRLQANAPTENDIAWQRAAAVKQIRDLVAEGGIDLALAAHRKMPCKFEDWKLPEADLRALILACLKHERYGDAIPLMRDYLRDYTEHGVAVRLKAAEVLIRHEQRPALARRVLAKLSDSTISPAHRQLRRQLDRQAQAMIDEGVLELQGEDW